MRWLRTRNLSFRKSFSLIGSDFSRVIQMFLKGLIEILIFK